MMIRRRDSYDKGALAYLGFWGEINGGQNFIL